MDRSKAIWIAVGFAAALVGCGEPKSITSFRAAVQPNAAKASVKMDPYTYGGFAEATGGLDSKASYGSGAPGKDDGDPAHYGYPQLPEPSEEPNAMGTLATQKPAGSTTKKPSPPKTGERGSRASTSTQ